LLDEECRFPKSSDASFLEKITAQHKDAKNFERAKTARTSFVVKHYAGDVSYEVKDFLEKNRDTMREDMLAILVASKVELVKTIFASAAGPTEELVICSVLLLCCCPVCGLTVVSAEARHRRIILPAAAAAASSDPGCH
jgi:hypothetical protein